MAKAKYVKVNVTALKAAMTGFKAGVAVHADEETKGIVNIFEDMILQYLDGEEIVEADE